MSQSMVDVLIVFNKTDIGSNDLLAKHNHYLFGSMKSSIKEIFGQNKYTVYNISSDELESTDGWHLTTALVITIGDQLVDHYFKAINNNVFNGKHINFKAEDLLIGNSSGNLSFDCDLFKRQIISNFNCEQQIDSNNGSNETNLRDKNSGKVYLITKDKELFLKKHKHLIESKLRLIDETNQRSDENKETSDSKLDITIDPNLNDISFDSKIYYSNLKTERLGHSFAFVDITDSTMTLIESFNGIDGFVAIANQQTSGRGRNQNEWLSPKGCAMFTVQLSIGINTNIGRKMAFIQHLVGLSIVKAINTIPGYEELELGLKWPNDILWRKNKSKFCGVLITSSFNNKTFNVLIGCGINISNSRPSVCLNGIIDDYNSNESKKLDHLNCEEVIARTLTQMEILLNTCELNNGIKIIEDLYLKNWIHSNEIIKLVDNNAERKVQIEGLDSDGYLLVRDIADGSTLSLHPSGNRFDIMRNLMIIRPHN